jgi:exonuclease SbcD
MIAGNHDSAGRLEAPAPLLESLGVQVVGALPRGDDHEIDFQRILLPLRDGDGTTAAWCAAVPFLRPADLPPTADSEDPLIDGVRQVYAEALARATATRQPDQAVIVTGHCYTVAGRVSELSERAVLGGHQHALPADIFDGADYAALGHLHLAQTVGDAAHIRYPGSPIPLSLAEADYPHQVLRVDLDASTVATAPIPVPRWVDILRLPAQGAAGLEEVLDQLAAVELDEELPLERQPLLEVAVRLERPEPALRKIVQDAIGARAVRLVSIAVSRAGSGAALADSEPQIQLSELQPEQVFARRYWQQHDDEPPAALREAFAELLQSVMEDEP